MGHTVKLEHIDTKLCKCHRNCNLIGSDTLYFPYIIQHIIKVLLFFKLYSTEALNKKQ